MHATKLKHWIKCMHEINAGNGYGARLGQRAVL